MSVAAPPRPSATLDASRTAVRNALTGQETFTDLDPDRRRSMANALVTVIDKVAALKVAEKEAGDASAAVLSAEAAPPTAAADTPEPAQAFATSANDELGLRATQQLAQTTEDVLDAVSFPRFVEELINGVFNAMVGSSISQMDAYIELLENVSQSTESFGERNIGNGAARTWLAEAYPESFELIVEGGDELGGFDDDPEEEQQQVEAALRLRPGASMPEEGRLRTDLGLTSSANLPSDPEQLVPLARQKLASSRQEMLASLVMLGMQRIVIDEGSIKAGMKFHIDARSAANAQRANKFNMVNQVAASGSYGIGPWGVSAAVSNTIGYVKTERVQTTEEINTDLTLDSSVEVRFRSDQIPLDHLASSAQADRIRSSSRNPTSSVVANAQNRDQRIAAQRQADAARANESRQALGSDPTPPQISASSSARNERGDTARSSVGAAPEAGAEAEAAAPAPAPESNDTPPAPAAEGSAPAAEGAAGSGAEGGGAGPPGEAGP